MLPSIALLALASFHGGAFPPPPAAPVPATPKPGNTAPRPAGVGGPNSPGGRGQAPANGSATSSGGSKGTNDLDWARWWKLERERFLLIRESMAAGPVSGGVQASAARPTRSRINEAILPPLLEVLETERDDSMISSALIAVARTGSDGNTDLAVRIGAAIKLQLRSKSQEVSETAALSLGILGENAAIEPLFHILANTKEGRELVGDESVPTRTRAFAAFGLGLMGQRRAEPALRQRIAAKLMEVLDTDQRGQELSTAAVIALGLCPVPNVMTVPDKETRGSERAFDVVSRSAQIRWLLERIEADPRSSKGLPNKTRVHAAVSLGRLAETANEEARTWAIETLAGLAGNRQAPTQNRTGALMGLGLAASAGAGPADEIAIDRLSEAIKSGQVIERHFAGIALAQATSRKGAAPTLDDGSAKKLEELTWKGLAPGRRSLLRHLARGRPESATWYAVALGLQSWHHQRAGAPFDASVGLALREKVRTERSASFVGAYAIGCALAHVGADEGARTKAGEQIHSTFGRTKDPVARGQVAIALGLLSYEPARDDLTKLLRTSRFQAELLWSTSVALALYQDEKLVWTLIDTLENARSASGRGAAAAALGRVGDARAVKPLLDLLADLDQPTAARAFAIVGLGLLCESTPLPWGTPAAHANPYFAVTTTLIGNGKGLLDLN